MNPEDVEKLLARVEPAPPPTRVERKVLAEGEKILRRDSDRASRPTREARDARRWGIAGVVAAGLVLSVTLWRVLVPRPGDPDWVPCRTALEFDTHLDRSAAAGPPAFPSGAPSLDAYAPLFRRADAVKPIAEELGWQRIPWVTDLDEAQRLARTERRPLFLWVASDDPLGRCCSCASGMRAGPLSREDVVRRVSAAFVPAALDRKVLLRGKGGEFLRSLQRQKPQYHGIWIVSPEGQVLAGYEGQKGKDSQDLLGTLETALKAFGPVDPRAVAPADLFPHRGAGLQPGGSVSLAVHARLMLRGARDGPVAFDTLTLSAAEWALLFPPRGTLGEEWIVPEALARTFCRLASPVSDPEFMPRPEQAKTAELRAKVASLDGGLATIELSGRWETEHSTSEGKPVRASARGEGVAVFDVRSRTLRSFLLVATGSFSNEASSGARETGAVLEWNAAGP